MTITLGNVAQYHHLVNTKLKIFINFKIFIKFALFITRELNFFIPIFSTDTKD